MLWSFGFSSAASKHTTRPACNKAASQCCLSLKRFVVVSAGFATFFTLNNVSKCFNGFDGRRKIHLYVDERKTWQEHWEDSFWRRASARNRQLFNLFMVVNCVNQSMELILTSYYLNTNEIPGELSRENMISSHVKITCYLHMWKDHRCDGYIINRAFHRKKLFRWNGLVFHWCLYNK